MFEKQTALHNLNEVLKPLDPSPIFKKVTDHWETDGLMYVKKQISGGGFIEVGYEKFKHGKVSFFLHAKLPKAIPYLEEVKRLIGYVVEQFPKIEVYYDENFVDDHNGGKSFCERTHAVLGKFRSKGVLAVVENEIGIMQGTIKPKYAGIAWRSSFDYDLAYARM